MFRQFINRVRILTLMSASVHLRHANISDVVDTTIRIHDTNRVNDDSIIFKVNEYTTYKCPIKYLDIHCSKTPLQIISLFNGLFIAADTDKLSIFNTHGKLIRNIQLNGKFISMSCYPGDQYSTLYVATSNNDESNILKFNVSNGLTNV